MKEVPDPSGDLKLFLLDSTLIFLSVVHTAFWFSLYESLLLYSRGRPKDIYIWYQPLKIIKIRTFVHGINYSALRELFFLNLEYTGCKYRLLLLDPCFFLFFVLFYFWIIKTSVTELKHAWHKHTSIIKIIIQNN